MWIFQCQLLLSSLSLCATGADLPTPAAALAPRFSPLQAGGEAGAEQDPPVSLRELVTGQAYTRADAEERANEGDEARGPVRTIMDFVVASDGTVRWVVVSANELLDRDGRAALVPARFFSVGLVEDELEARIDLSVEDLAVLPGFEPRRMKEPADLDRLIAVLDRTTERAPENPPSRSGSAAQPAASRLLQHMFASDLFELVVIAGDDDCGEVDDAVFDPRSRRVGHLLVGSCASGTSDALILVPTAVTTWGLQDEQVVIRVKKSRSELNEGPRLSLSGDEWLGREELEAADRFFGLRGEGADGGDDG